VRIAFAASTRRSVAELPEFVAFDGGELVVSLAAVR
jgi:hypothetical protein